MINIVLVVVSIAVLLVLAFYAGLYIRDLNDKIDRLSEAQKPEPTPAVTLGAYRSVNENAVNKEDNLVGLVTPKSPQLLEFEEQEELRKMSLGPR